MNFSIAIDSINIIVMTSVQSPHRKFKNILISCPQVSGIEASTCD